MESFRAWLRALRAVNPLITDGVMALAVLVISLLSTFGSPRIDIDFRKPDTLGYLLVAAQCLPVAIRRIRPDIALPISGIGIAAYSALGYEVTVSWLGVLICLYSIAAHAPRPIALNGLAWTMVGMAFSLLGGPLALTIEELFGNYVIFVTAWVLGDRVRTGHAYTAELEARTALLESQQEDNARRAVMLERNRIARELHDIIAHSVSVMVVQAGAARRVAATDPGRTRSSLEAIESTGREALAEMRRLLGIMRSPEEEEVALSPVPGVAGLEALVENARSAGLEVELEVRGEVRPLPPGVDLSAYRIVQEALTNALKHGGPSSACVRMIYRPSTLEIEITDDGRGALPALGQAATVGHGLLGMRERAAAFGGALKAGPRRGGGFEVKASLPLDATP
ncbi:MAG: sensor histidine kinase [Actinomycetota bacterium]|nr:sensor histidine kinase [Actinomycetota bacterium]